MWTLIIIIVVVVVVDDDAYYWVYLSSDHLFQVYYKVRQVLLQSATAFFITKCDGLLLQSATAFLLQSATSVITKCDRYYKVRQFYYKVRRLLQSATVQRTPNKAPTWSKLRSVVWLNVNKTIFGHLWHVLVTFNFHFELSTIRAEQFKQILFSLLVHF